MSAMKPVSKGVLVSFTSDSDDEGNTSSSSSTRGGSSRDDCLSSDDEAAGRCGKSGRKNKSGAAAVSKEKTSNKDEKPVYEDLPVLQTSRAKNGLSSEVKSDSSSTSVDAVTAAKSKKSSRSSEGEIETKVIDSVSKTNVENEEGKSSKSKKKAFTEDPGSMKSGVIDPEERNLAPPSKSKIKNRAKSPKDENVESSADVIVVDKKNKSSGDTIESAEERNLAPAATKRRDKSPKDTVQNGESLYTTDLSAVAKTMNTNDQTIDDSADKTTKIKKKKKQPSEEKDEVEIIDGTDSKASVDTTSTKKKKSKEADDAPQVAASVSPSFSDAAAAGGEDAISGRIHKKKSAKTSDSPPVNGEKDLEIPQAPISSESPSLRRKKKKEFTDEVNRADQDASIMEKERKPSTEISMTSTADTLTDEKPKKKKSSKAAVDVDTMLTQPADEGAAVKVVGQDFNVSSKLSDVQASEFVNKKTEKPLESAVLEERIDAVVVSEVQDLPTSDVKIVRPVCEEVIDAAKKVEGLESSSGLINGFSKTDLGTEVVGEKLLSETLATSEEAEEEERKARKKASEALNDEVAKYLESLPTYTRPSIVDTSTDENQKEGADTTKPSADDKLPEEENSEFTQRRQSMDDFIKKILAEAREERQRLKGNLEADATLLSKVSGETVTSPMALVETSGLDKDSSMLERRLASVEKKRQKESDDDKAILGKLNGPGVKGKLGDDEDDEITRILNARRAQRKAREEGLDIDDLESLPSEAGSMRPRGRRDREDFDDDESIASSKPPLMPGGRLRAARQQQPEGGERCESFVSKWRKEREASQLPEDSFAPRRSDQTDEVIRERTRHIRIIVEQQADVAKSMRATSRSMDELENEIREVRQLSLDWQARIEALEGAIDAEYRQYEMDQQGANERLRQQRVPDDRALREELRAIGRNRRVRGESVEDEGFVTGSRRRSGSVASTASVASSYLGRGLDSGLELDYYLGGGAGASGAGRRADLRRTESDSDFSGERLRRGGSLSRNISDMLGGSDNDDILGLRSRGSASRTGADSSAAPPISDEVMRIRAKYSTLNNGPSAGYSPSSRLSSGADIGGSGYNLSTSYSSRKDQPLYSSRYGDSSSSSVLPSRYSSGLGTLGSLSGGSDYTSPSSLDSSRIRRSMSVSDMNFDRPSFRSSSLANYGDPATDFRSKFLSKVRTTKDDYGSSAPTSSTRAKDKPFKSRFLKSGSALSDSTPPSRFSSTGSASDGGAAGATSSAQNHE